uniref:Uncharacterized protein n=1 Tax=Arundo donax TaxID=35708 RepID=A0A0A9HMN4_ARUDO
MIAGSSHCAQRCESYSSTQLTEN